MRPLGAVLGDFGLAEDAAQEAFAQAGGTRVERELGRPPRYPTWRTGFEAAYSAIAERTQDEPALDLAG